MKKTEKKERTHNFTLADIKTILQKIRASVQSVDDIDQLATKYGVKLDM